MYLVILWGCRKNVLFDKDKNVVGHDILMIIYHEIRKRGGLGQ